MTIIYNSLQKSEGVPQRVANSADLSSQVHSVFHLHLQI